MRLGPEPLNTVAPTISGTTTLTATTGTWNSQSNGTLSYSYQWTKDGVDISGGTSSTYNTASVAGVYRCRVRASNDGGFDSAQDTLSSNSITVSGGSSVTGSANQQELADTQNATGSLSLNASASQLELADSQTASGSLTITGSANQTELADSQTASGSLTITGAANQTEVLILRHQLHR